MKPDSAASRFGLSPDFEYERTGRHYWEEAVPHFYVYAITFDQDTFGIFATREEAAADLRRQIEQGGPAWGDCEIQRWRVEGEPEVHREE